MRMESGLSDWFPVYIYWREARVRNATTYGRSREGNEGKNIGKGSRIRTVRGGKITNSQVADTEKKLRTLIIVIRN